LELLHHHVGPSTKSLRRAHQPIKFYANLMRSFCLFTPSKFRFLGKVIDHHRDQQKAHPWPESHLCGDFVGDPSCSPAVRLGANRRNQKERKVMKETYSGKLGVRPNHPRCRIDIKLCMQGGLGPSGDISKLQLSSKSVERFSRYRGSPFRCFI